MVFEAWRYNVKKQHFDEAVIYMDNHFFPSQEWEILNVDSKIEVLKYSTGDFDQAIFYITIKRKTEYFALTAILPCLLIGAIELITFMVPYNETVRLELSFTCLLAYSMFQMMITTDMPKSAKQPPLLLLLISLFTVHISVAIFLQGICIYLSDLAKHQTHKKPSGLVQRFASRVASLGGINVRKSISPPSTNNSPEPTEPGTSAENTVPNLGNRNLDQSIDIEDEPDVIDYNFIARVIDRISFIFFLFLLLGTALGLLVIIPAVNNWGM